MESVLHEAWWCKIKITPKVASHPTKPALLAPDEALGECCLLKLLGITMTEFWTVLFECNLARQKGQVKIIDREKVAEFTTRTGLTAVPF
jgi:hypothetical protein